MQLLREEQAWIDTLVSKGCQLQRLREERYYKDHPEDPDPWLATAFGNQLHFLQPRSWEVRLWFDQIHAVSQICRFGGHTRRFYGVGEHSVRVHDLLVFWRRSKSTCVAGLIHDLGEAWYHDMPSPIKRQSGMGWYRAQERAVQAAIWQAAGLQDVDVETIRLADLTMLATERQALLVPQTWDFPLPPPIPLPWWDRMGWSPRRARRVFLRRLAGYDLPKST